MKAKEHSTTKVLLLGIVVAIFSLASMNEASWAGMINQIFLTENIAAKPTQSAKAAVLLEKLAQSKRLTKKSDRNNANSDNSIRAGIVSTSEETPDVKRVSGCSDRNENSSSKPVGI